MTALTLKFYQQAALDALAAFARAAQATGPVLAFGELAGRPYNADAFGAQVPCVCLRIPAGGGKTVLAAHAVPPKALRRCLSNGLKQPESKKAQGLDVAQQLDAVLQWAATFTFTFFFPEFFQPNALP